MSYLYGDSTASPLRSNFLAFLRDALDFCVHLIQAQERIDALHEDGREKDRHAEAERVRIRGLRALVVEAAESANTEGPGSASQRAVDRVKAASDQGIATTLDEIAAKLANEHAALDVRERAERDSCLDSLADMLAGHEPHDGSWRVQVELGASGYVASCEATTPYGIAWNCSIVFGEGHPLAGVMKVGEAVPQLELSLPEPGGFLKKGKVKPQRVDQYSLEAFVADAHAAKISVRQAPRTPIGLDISIVGTSVEMQRTGVKDHVECEVSADDAQKLIALRDKLLETVTTRSGLKRTVTTATFDDEPLGERPDLGEVVERVIQAAAPITKEIQAHSLSPHELVIRRLLGNDRREEVFVTTASLLDKLAPLDEEQRGVFGALGLRRVRPRTPLPEETVDDEPMIVRTRIRPVTPVALPVFQPPAPVAIAAQGTPSPEAAESARVESASVELASVESVSANSTRADSSHRESPSPEAPSAESHHAESHHAEAQHAESPSARSPLASPSAVNAEGGTAAPRISSSNMVTSSPRESGAIPVAPGESIEIDATSKESLAATVKRIVGSARGGRTTEAFEAYAALFEDPDFARQRPQDQRQVLKLMVLAKSAPPPSPMVTEAYRNALLRLKVLHAEGSEGVDAEMIAACEVMLERPAAE
ncbi:MAG: hypothetical protein ACKV2T_11015 [Kofleriaceae bacterium]